MYSYLYKRDNADTRDLQFSKSFSPHSDIILPRSVDLRPKCPPVYDQGEMGSCTANAGCTCRAMLLEGQETNLSRMFLYYAERLLEDKTNKDSGASLRDTCKSLQRLGVCEETYMPYNPEKYKERPSRLAVYNASEYKITAYKSLSSLDEIKQNLAFRQQPILLGMDVYESFKSKAVSKTGIMPIPHRSEKKLGGHAVLVVGYKNTPRCRKTRGYLIVRNSWGEKWGDKGYFYMPYNYVTPDFTYDYWMIE